MEDERNPGSEAAGSELPVDEEAPEVEPVAGLGERPEADVLEQAAVVRTEQELRPASLGPEVPEADALEQAIEEPLDDEER